MVLRYGGDIRGLVNLGAKFPHPAELADAPFAGPVGYDGQFYAALATDPLLLRSETVRYLDIPAYRAGRIGLPLLAWVASAGSGSRGIMWYLTLCWLGALGGIWIVGYWLAKEGHSPWWSLPLVFSAAMASSMSRALPDAAAAALIVLALWLHRRHRILPVVAALILAALIRETSLAAAIAVGVEELLRRRFAAAAVLTVIPAACLFGWRLWVVWVTGQTFGWQGMRNTWTIDSLSRSVPLPAMIGAALLTLAVIAVIPHLAEWPHWGAAEYTYVLFAALGVFANTFISLDLEALRIIVVLPLLAVLLAEQQSAGFSRVMLRLVPLAFGAAGGYMMLTYHW